MINSVNNMNYMSNATSVDNHKSDENRKEFHIVGSVFKDEIKSNNNTVNVSIVGYDDYKTIKQLEKELGTRIFLEKGKQLHVYEFENFESTLGVSLKGNKVISQIDVGGNRSYRAYSVDGGKLQLQLSNDNKTPVDGSVFKNVVAKGIKLMSETNLKLPSNDFRNGLGLFMSIDYDKRSKNADYESFSERLLNLVEFSYSKHVSEDSEKDVSKILGELEECFSDILMKII